MKKNKTLFIIILLVASMRCSLAQPEKQASLFIPEGTQYSVIPNAENVSSCAIHPNGQVWIVHENVIECEGGSIELPAQIKPTLLCWTRSGRSIIYCHDTLYVIDSTYTLRPLVNIVANEVVIQPFGSDDISFCVAGDTIIYTFSFTQDTVISLLSYPHPIIDFVVDGKDIFFATGKHVVAYSKDKQYIPIFQNNKPIRSIAFCGDYSMFFSDEEGIWLVDNERNKSAILNYPSVDIVTGNRGQGFFKLLDESWLIVFPITNYEINNNN